MNEETNRSRAPVATLLSSLMLVASPAWASLVRVHAGGAEGQGYAFTLERKCLAFTANHVVAGARQAELISVAGERVTASVHRRDEARDLALLVVSEATTRSRPKLCSGANAISMDVAGLIARLKVAKVILQRVPSRAGSLDQTAMRVSGMPVDSDWFSLAPAAQDSIAQGDSGATVWLDNVVRRTGVEGTGTLLGMIVSVQGDEVRVLRADVLQQAIFAMLWPLEIEKLRFSPGNATLVAMGYGSFPAPPARLATQSMSWSSGVATMHLTFDLGDRDTVVESVSVSMLSLANVGRRLIGGLLFAESPRRTDLKVQTSQARPGETHAWTDQRCFRDRGANPGNCQFRTPVVARGLRIQLEGEVSQLNSVSMKVIE